MIFTEFTMLGKTAPEVQADKRKFVCSAGIDPSFGLVRIYPLAVEDAPARWDKNSIEVGRNPRDNRDESFQIYGERDVDNHAAINRMFTKVGKTKPHELEDVVRRNTALSIEDLNTKRRSLGFVPLPAGTSHLHWGEDQKHPDHPQGSLELGVPGEGVIGKESERSAFTPKLRFGLGGAEHCLTLRDWGTYEFMRKYGRDGLYQALNLHLDRLLLIGNHNRFRNSWLVISVLAPIGSVAGFAENQLSLVTA